MTENNNRRCVIVGNTPVDDREYVKSILSPEDFYIFCDGGLKHLEWIKDLTGRDPDLIVGDFDSAKDPHMAVETITLPTVKDDTDTFFAAKEAVRREFEDFLLIGVIGGRLDHTLGNISVLLYLHKEGKSALAVDDFSDMEIVGSGIKTVEGTYPYFSLLNIGGDPKGINIKNAKYPLVNAEILPEYQYGISNEVLTGSRAEVYVNEGYLLLVKVRKG